MPRHFQCTPKERCKGVCHSHISIPPLPYRFITAAGICETEFSMCWIAPSETKLCFFKSWITVRSEVIFVLYLLIIFLAFDRFCFVLRISDAVFKYLRLYLAGLTLKICKYEFEVQFYLRIAVHSWNNLSPPPLSWATGTCWRWFAEKKNM